MAGEYPDQNQIPGQVPQAAPYQHADAQQQAVERACQEALARQEAYRQKMIAEQQANQQAQQYAIPQQSQHYAPQQQPAQQQVPQQTQQYQPAYEPAPQPAIYTSQPAYNASGQHVAEQKPSILRSFLSFLLMLVVVFGAAFLLRMFVIAPYEIPSGSMEPTIMISDKVFSEKISYYLGDVKPGDIVTFEDPEVAGRTLIKRCIAVGGQTVDVHDGFVFIDGQQLNEPYVEGKPSEPLQPAEGVEISYPYTIPAGYIWVMGDNRTNSADSRYFGAVPASGVTGHAICVYWPLDRIGGLG